MLKSARTVTLSGKEKSKLFLPEKKLTAHTIYKALKFRGVVVWGFLLT